MASSILIPPREMQPSDPENALILPYSSTGDNFGSFVPNHMGYRYWSQGNQFEPTGWKLQQESLPCFTGYQEYPEQWPQLSFEWGKGHAVATNQIRQAEPAGPKLCASGGSHDVRYIDNRLQNPHSTINHRHTYSHRPIGTGGVAKTPTPNLHRGQKASVRGNLG